jgi:hypothetical protein
MQIHAIFMAFFAYATPRIPIDELAEPLEAARIPVLRVGDARNARRLMAAVAEGHEAANAV